MNESVREPACAGRFYPADETALREAVEAYLEDASGGGEIGRPRAVIAPHAGYPYSGPIAGEAFAALGSLRETVDRVVLVGPSHFVRVSSGLAVPTREIFETPLGRVRVETGVLDELVEEGVAAYADGPHEREHSLETHLPFLQEMLGDFAIVPVVTGSGAEPAVARLFDEVVDASTVVSVSSDLSHYLDYDSARRVDDTTREAVEAFEPDAIDDRQACGHTAVRGLLDWADASGFGVETLAMANSGDTAGGRDEVVGYGAWAFGASSASARVEAAQGSNET